MIHDLNEIKNQLKKITDLSHIIEYDPELNGKAG